MVSGKGAYSIKITYVCRCQGIIFPVGQPQFIASLGVRYRPKSRYLLHKNRRSRQGFVPVVGHSAGYDALCGCIDCKKQADQ